VPEKLHFNFYCKVKKINQNPTIAVFLSKIEKSVKPACNFLKARMTITNHFTVSYSQPSKT